MRRVRSRLLVVPVLLLALAAPGLPASAAAAPPPNDDLGSFAGTAIPVRESGSNVDASAEAGEPAPCGQIDQTVWYAFQTAEATRYTADTTRSRFDTAMAVYEGPLSGASFDDLRLIDCNDDEDLLMRLSELTWSARPGVGYYVQVGSAKDSPGGDFSLTVDPADGYGPEGRTQDPDLPEGASSVVLESGQLKLGVNDTGNLVARDSNVGLVYTATGNDALSPRATSTSAHRSRQPGKPELGSARGPTGAGACSICCQPVLLKPERGGGVVRPGLLHAHVAAEGGQAAVAGLVGDGASAGAAQVGVGDEAGAQAVRAAGRGVQAGAGDGLLHEAVDGLGVQVTGAGLVALADRAQQRAVGDAGELLPALQGQHGAAVGVAGGGARRARRARRSGCSWTAAGSGRARWGARRPGRWSAPQVRCGARRRRTGPAAAPGRGRHCR